MLMLLSLTLVSCNYFEKKSGNVYKVGKLAPLIDEQFLLDSTRIGRSTIISDLDVPWEIAWGPDNWIWFTEQEGRVSRVNPETGEKKILLEIPEVLRKRTTGLLGMAVHPNLKQFPYIFLHYTYMPQDSIISRLVRYTYEGEVLINPEVLLEIPGHTAHNGSRLTIAPDGKIMWATGDIGPNTDNAQDVQSLNGKILRLNIDGSIPKDNPFSGSPVWSWGQRNVQGMVYGVHGNLYTSEHGDATDDEVNLMWKGGNYGWPNVEGYCDTPEEKLFCQDSVIIAPLKSWTPTIAPAGIDYYDSKNIPEWENALLLTTLKENDLRVLKLNAKGDSIVSETVLFDRSLGRIRDICISPQGDVYLATSNRDWNPSEGFPVDGDDRIVKVFKLGKNFKENSMAFTANELQVDINYRNNDSSGEVGYKQYCASCHKSDGNGVKDIFPSLLETPKVMGEKGKLIEKVLNGTTSSPDKEYENGYDQIMPSFNFLTDQEIALILTYVRSQFGNNSSPVSSKEVGIFRGN